jgi:hypothetical protein
MCGGLWIKLHETYDIWLESNIGVFQTSLVQAHIICPTLLKSNSDGFGLTNFDISYQNCNQNWMKFSQNQSKME